MTDSGDSFVQKWEREKHALQKAYEDALTAFRKGKIDKGTYDQAKADFVSMRQALKADRAAPEVGGDAKRAGE